MTTPLDETQARQWIHRELDGEPLSADERRRLEAHLEDCADCRALRADLRRVQGALRALPDVPLPDRALDEVLARTSRRAADPAPAAPPRTAPLPFRSRRRAAAVRPWAWAAVAAVALLGVLGIYRLEQRQAELRDAETAEALEQARRLEEVFRLTSSAIDRSTRSAVRDVVGDEVAPALRRIPVRFPGPQAAAPDTEGPGGTETGNGIEDELGIERDDGIEDDIEGETDNVDENEGAAPARAIRPGRPLRSERT